MKQIRKANEWKMELNVLKCFSQCLFRFPFVSLSYLSFSILFPSKYNLFHFLYVHSSIFSSSVSIKCSYVSFFICFLSHMFHFSHVLSLFRQKFSLFHTLISPLVQFSIRFNAFTFHFSYISTLFSLKF